MIANMLPVLLDNLPVCLTVTVLVVGDDLFRACLDDAN
jgi:hypothetical protein